MEEIVVFGSGGHAKVVIDIIEKEESYRLIGLIDSYKALGSSYFNYSILGNGDDYSIIKNVYGGIIAIGDNWSRSVVTQMVKTIAPNFRFVTCIHPQTTIGRAVHIGQGTAIMAGAIINSGTFIGDGCIINTGASVDHDSNISDFASLAPGVTTGGHVTVGEGTAIGIGTSIIQGVQIGEHSVIGAGATVIRDIPALVVALGTPCVVARNRKKGEKYL